MLMKQSRPLHTSRAARQLPFLTHLRRLPVAIAMLLLAMTAQTAWADDYPAYITDVMVIGGDGSTVDSKWATYQSQGYKKIDFDLNSDAGGDYVYVLYKTGSRNSTDGGYITDLVVSTTDASSVTYNGTTYTRVAHDGSDHFKKYGGNLNSGAKSGSTNMWLFYTKKNFSDKRAVNDIVVNTSSSKSGYTTIGKNGGSDAYDLNAGAGGDYVYMHFSTTTKRNRPASDPTMKTGLVYTGQPLQLVSYNPTSQCTMYYRVGTSGSYTSTVSSITATNAGTYTVYYYAATNSYGDYGPTFSKTVTISKAANSGVTVSCADGLESVAPSPTVSGTNLSTGDITYLYSTSQNGTYSSTVPTTAGTYWVKATVAADANCNEYTTAAASFTMTPDWAVRNSGDSEADAYVINTTTDLDLLAQRVNAGNNYSGKFFRLGANITYDGTENNFTPIGVSDAPFAGTFDGGGLIISGLNINQPSTDYIGLFGMAGSAVIKNLTLANSTFCGERFVGAILGDGGYTSPGYTTVENCVVASTVTVTAGNYVGGIVSQFVTVRGCVCAATVSATTTGNPIIAGGIIGNGNESTVSHCLYTGTSVTANTYKGAIAGYKGSAYLSNNYYTQATISGTNEGDTDGARKAVQIISNTAGVGVTPTGSYAKTYNVSRIYTFDGSTAIQYYNGLGMCLIAGATETVNLDITYASPYEGFSLSGYTDGNGHTLTHVSGNTYTLTMPATTVSITPEGQDLWGQSTDGRDGSTAAKAFRITTPAGLDLLAQKVNAGTSYSDKYFELGADIEYDKTVENNYTPIGNESNTFKGHFDGKGHTVSGINVNLPSNDYVGLFAQAQDATIQNLTLANSTISGKNYVGGFVGMSEIPTTIQNCHAGSDVTVSGRDGVGGIVGLYATIRGCTCAATVTGNIVGGITGTANYSVIENCLVYGGAINGTDAGAIAGTSTTDGTLTNNRYTGGVTLNGSEAKLNDGVGSGEQDGAAYACAIIPYESVTLNIPSVSATTEYPYDGLKIYPTGMTYKGQYYNYYYNNDAGISGDVTFTATYTGSVPEDYALGGFGSTSIADNKNVEMEWEATDGSATCTLCTDYAAIYYIAPTFRNAIWGDGDGTQGNPYIITNVRDMNELASRVNSGEDLGGKYFELGADITYDGTENNYTPIGTSDHPFCGNFDGQGHTISGISVNANEMANIGVFGINDGTVKNLTVSDCLFAGNGSVGAIAGMNRGTVENCHVAAYVGVTGNNGVGGIAGDNEGFVLGCTSAATLSAKEYASYFGGIAGGDRGTLTDNLFTGTIGEMPDGSWRIGAITGYHNTDYDGTLTNNFHTCSGMVGVGNDNDATNTDQAGAQFAVSRSTQPDASIIGEEKKTYGGTDYTGITAYEHALYYNGKYYYFSLWGGSGTEADPYVIYNTEGLDKLATNVNGGNYYEGSYFVLGNNIVYTPDVLTLDLDNDGNNDSNYMPVGKDGPSFLGNFDGQGHTISGILVNTNEMDYISVFGINDGTVKNLTVSGCLFAGNGSVGAIAGLNRGTVENCHVAAYVGVTGNNGVGGIAGDNEGFVLGCTSAATLSAKEYASYFGGIAGGDRGTLTDNLFTGTIGEMPDGSWRIGAITGYHNTDYDGTLTNNFHTCSGMVGVGNDNDATNTDQAGAQFAVSRSTQPDASIIGEEKKTYGGTEYTGITAYENGLYYNGNYYYRHEDVFMTIDLTGDATASAPITLWRLIERTMYGVYVDYDNYTIDLNLDGEGDLQLVPDMGNGVIRISKLTGAANLTTNSLFELIEDGSFPYNGLVIKIDNSYQTEKVRPIFGIYDSGKDGMDVYNSSNIRDNDGKQFDVMLKDRTFKKDGKWQTIVLPFDVDLAATDCPLYGATARAVTEASISGSTLNLTFGKTWNGDQNMENTLVAGTPYLIKWDKAADYVDDDAHNIVNPVFTNVNLVRDGGDFWNEDKSVGFFGDYDALPDITTYNLDYDVLLLGADNTLHYAGSGASLGACRAYFLVKKNGGSGDVTGDGAVTIADVARIIDKVKGGEPPVDADVTGDGRVDMADVLMLKDVIIGKQSAQPVTTITTNLDDDTLTLGSVTTSYVR